jgi:hypothetical protein
MEHLSAVQFAAWAAIAVVLAVAAGLALAALGSRRAARRMASHGPAERWRRQ